MSLVDADWTTASGDIKVNAASQRKRVTYPALTLFREGYQHGSNYQEILQQYLHSTIIPSKN